MIIFRYSVTLLWPYWFDEKSSSEILGMCRIFKYFGKTVIVINSSNTYLSAKYISEYTFETRSKKKPPICGQNTFIHDGNRRVVRVRHNTQIRFYCMLSVYDKYVLNSNKTVK